MKATYIAASNSIVLHSSTCIVVWQDRKISNGELA